MDDHPLQRRIARLTAPIAVALVALLLAGAGSAAAAPDPDQGFGYNVQTLVRSTQPNKPPRFLPDAWPTYLGPMTRDGFRLARADALWGTAEPKAPSGGVHSYDWSATDEIAAGLARAGVRWDVVLNGSPKWAGGASSFGAPAADHYADFAAFTGAFAARYGTGGAFWAAHPELPALPVRRFEVWNEPNTQVHWGTTPDAAAYARLFTGAQAAIKAADPAAQVSAGGIVWNDDVAYIQAFFAALGPGVTVDSLGTHPYAPTVFALAANVVRVRSALDALGLTKVPLDINELGWPAAYDRAPATHAVDGPVSDAARAATMALAIDSLARSTCDVSDLVVYSLVEGEDDPGHIESLMGLYRRDGGASTLTSTAFADSVARYRAEVAKPGPPVPVCGARGALATQVLPLKLTGVPGPAGCVTTTVTYRGNPLEEAQVRLRSPGFATRASDANGQAPICIAAGRRPPIRLSADVPGVAASNELSCDLKTCRAIGPAAACAARAVALIGSRRLATVLRRGVKVQTSACNPQIGAPVRLRATLQLTRSVARRAGLAVRTRVVTIGRGSAQLLPGATVQVTSRFTAAARRALRSARRVPVTLTVRAVEGATVDQVTRKVTLKR